MKKAYSPSQLRNLGYNETSQTTEKRRLCLLMKFGKVTLEAHRIAHHY